MKTFLVLLLAALVSVPIVADQVGYVAGWGR
jgi:hypothetical protein